MARKIINPKSTGAIVFALTEAELTSDPVAISEQVIEFRVRPSANLATVPATYGAAEGESAAASSFNLELSILQDWGKADSVSEFLYDHDGEVVWFQHDPAGTSEPTIKGSVYAVAGGWGGPADDNWVDDLTMPCIGKPTIT